MKTDNDCDDTNDPAYIAKKLDGYYDAPFDPVRDLGSILRATEYQYTTFDDSAHWEAMGSISCPSMQVLIKHGIVEISGSAKATVTILGRQVAEFIREDQKRRNRK